MLTDNLSVLRRMRDFNLPDSLSIQEQHKEKIGLRIVKGLAYHVQYMSALKINPVVISIPAQADNGEEILANVEDGR